MTSSFVFRIKMRKMINDNNVSDSSKVNDTVN